MKQKVMPFTVEVEKMKGPSAWSFIEFPFVVADVFGKKGVVRIKGTINGIPMDRALMPRKSGYHLIILSAELLRKAKTRVGEKARFEVWLNEHPDEVLLSEELKGTIGFFPEFASAWNKLKPGMKRSICLWINSGKTTETRSKRVAELLKRSETGHPWFAPKASKS